MNEPTITCPTCKTEIKLTESLAQPLIESTRTEYEQRFRTLQQEIGTRESRLSEEREQLIREKEAIDETVSQRLAADRQKIEAEEGRKARQLVSVDLEKQSKEIVELKQLLDSRSEKLAEAQEAQADVIRQQRELDDAKRELDLTVEKRVQQSLSKLRVEAKQSAQDEFKLKLSEKEQTIESMKHEIENLKRKAEQGSEQLQGEVQEIELESLLKSEFPLDTIQPVPKGEHGGDVLHRVIGAHGRLCGTILWEAKRTKSWTDTWLAKLRSDQREAKAEIAVIISKTLPSRPLKNCVGGAIFALLASFCQF